MLNNSRHIILTYPEDLITEDNLKVLPEIAKKRCEDIETRNPMSRNDIDIIFNDFLITEESLKMINNIFKHYQQGEIILNNCEFDNFTLISDLIILRIARPRKLKNILFTGIQLVLENVEEINLLELNFSSLFLNNVSMKSWNNFFELLLKTEVKNESEGIFITSSGQTHPKLKEVMNLRRRLVSSYHRIWNDWDESEDDYLNFKYKTEKIYHQVEKEIDEYLWKLKYGLRLTIMKYRKSIENKVKNKGLENNSKNRVLVLTI